MTRRDNDPLLKLAEYGQSYWLDDLGRRMIESGELQRRVSERGLRGVTSNPGIFHKAIADSKDYERQIEKAVAAGFTAQQLYEALMVTDVRNACDILRSVYDKTNGIDGYVSLEVSPHLAHDSDGSVEEARRLHNAVNRPNLFIKIPGTQAGISAIEECLLQGININITLLFSIERYEEVALSYTRALERRLAAGRPVAGVASVASFFLSRIDVLVDELLSHRIRTKAGPQVARLLGKAAVANAKLAYQRFNEILNTSVWKGLTEKGATVQRILWASTSTKNPDYDDVMYVEPLIGPHTVNTMPAATIEAFDDHGNVRATIEEGAEEAREIMIKLDQVGVDLQLVTTQLENEGIQKFIEPYDALLELLEFKREHYRKRAKAAR